MSSRLSKKMGMRRVLARNLRTQRVGESSGPMVSKDRLIPSTATRPRAYRAKFAKLVKDFHVGFRAALLSTGGGGRIAAPFG